MIGYVAMIGGGAHGTTATTSPALCTGATVSKTHGLGSKSGGRKMIANRGGRVPGRMDAEAMWCPKFSGFGEGFRKV